MSDDNAGWLKNTLMWDYMDLMFDGYPGWELMPARAGERQGPYGAVFDWVSGKKPNAYDIAVKWDDLAEVRFHWREWMDDGGAVCRKGDLCHARFDFQTRAERDHFVAEYAKRGVRGVL